MEENHRRVLGWYESLLVAAGRAARGMDTDEAVRTDHVRTWARLRQARIFEFTEGDYATLFHTMDVYTTEVIAKHAWRKSDDPRDLYVSGLIGDHDGWSGWKDQIPGQPCCADHEEFLTRINTAAATIPYPEHLPFEVCYFAFGAGVRMTREQICAHLKTSPESPMAPRDFGFLVAILATATGHAYEMFVCGWKGFETTDSVQVYINPIAGPADEQQHLVWTAPFGSLGPWILNGLVNVVNGYDSVVREGVRTFADRHRFKKLSKQQGTTTLPPPYYIVQLKQTTLTNARSLLPPRPRAFSHRFDVRGHFMHRYMRGTLPIDQALYHKLVKRGYRIYSAIAPLDPDVLHFLVTRRIAPPERHEWLALKKSWREHFIKGPEAKEYIPSTHRADRLPRVLAQPEGSP